MHSSVLVVVVLSLALASALDITLKPAAQPNSINRRSDGLYLADQVELIYAERAASFPPAAITFAQELCGTNRNLIRK
jgi:hypothetical protein